MRHERGILRGPNGRPVSVRVFWGYWRWTISVSVVAALILVGLMALVAYLWGPVVALAALVVLGLLVSARVWLELKQRRDEGHP